MASGPITSRRIDGETMETVTDFIFLGSKITADGDFGNKIKRCLLLGRKVMTNLDSILKSRDIAKEICIVKAVVFPEVMYGYESWTVKKAEHHLWRIDIFKLWCLTRLLRVLWITWRSNHSTLKEISSEYLLEGLKLKFQYFGCCC